MARRSDVLQVQGIRCERCVLRLGAVLGGLEGLESANATLMGEVTLVWDEELLGHDTIIAAIERGGFQLAA